MAAVEGFALRAPCILFLAALQAQQLAEDLADVYATLELPDPCQVRRCCGKEQGCRS